MRLTCMKYEFMKSIVSISGLAIALAVTGCSTPNTVGPAVVQIAVQTGAAYGMQQDTNTIPYIRAATPVICNAAGSGTLDPAAVVAALQSSNADALKTPAAIIIINGALALYEAVYAQYGTNIQASVVQPYLQAVCSGLTAALPTATKPTLKAEWRVR